MSWQSSNSFTCGGKKKFDTWKQAQTHNNMMRKEGSALRHKGRKIEKLHPYRCRKCGFIHLGHEPRRPHRPSPPL